MTVENERTPDPKDAQEFAFRTSLVSPWADLVRSGSIITCTGSCPKSLAEPTLEHLWRPLESAWRLFFCFAPPAAVDAVSRHVRLKDVADV